MKTKICTICDRRKKVDAFGVKSRSPDGLNWNCKDCVSEYQRRRYAENPDLIRKQKREHMRRIRTDPLKRESQNASRRGNKKYLAKGREYNRDLKDRHFFKWRARLLNRTGNNVTPLQLMSLWKQQRGRCALSGRQLKRDAHVGHIHPRSKGGQTELANLRWLDPWVNVALQDLTDEEFVAGCSQVAEWIGRRIIAASCGLF